MIKKVIGAVLLGYLLINGCGLTEPDYTNDILPILLNFPEITPPLQTTDNSTNPGYLATIAHLEDICAYRSNMIRYQIQPFLDKGISGIKVGKNIEWRRVPDHNSEQLIILSVTRGDTLRFRLDFEGPGWGPPGAWFISGWYNPSLGGGYVENGGGIRTGWRPDEYGMNLGVRLVDPFVLGYDHVAIDSTNGGGSLSWDKGNQLSTDRFEASWDAMGHGSWWSDDYGSGEW